jgi:sortase A
MFRIAEYVAWALAAIMVTSGAAVGATDWLTQRARLAAFASDAAQSPSRSALTVAAPDRSDWAPARVRKYLASRAQRSAAPEAVLRIPSVGVEAEILPDTRDRSLDLGVGLIEGTPPPGEAGNTGIAGHRDGFFRRLKDIRPGDTIEVVTAEGRWRYAVDRTRIVAPTEVSVLAPTPHPALTLVTCYPFYFAGEAPQRFIVHARLVDQSASLPPLTEKTS